MAKPNTHVDFRNLYFARIGNLYIHQSLECLTPTKAWAWTPTQEQLARAKRKSDLVAQAKPVRILRNVQLQHGQVGI